MSQQDVVLSIKPVKASFQSKEVNMAQINSYLIFSYKNQRNTTAVNKNLGPQPLWDEIINLQVDPYSSDQLKIDCFKSFQNRPDLFLGGSYIDMEELSKSGERWFEIYHAKLGKVGELFLQWFVNNSQKMLPSVQKDPAHITQNFSHQPGNSSISHSTPYAVFAERRFDRWGNDNIAKSGPPADRCRLWIKPIRAKFPINLDPSKDMDPYVIIKVGQQERKTSVVRAGGKTPEWMEDFFIDLLPTDEYIEIYCYDHDEFKGDDFIADRKIELDDLLVNYEGTEWVNLNRYEREGGKIEISWRASGLVFESAAHAEAYGLELSTGYFPKPGSKLILRPRSLILDRPERSTNFSTVKPFLAFKAGNQAQTTATAELRDKYGGHVYNGVLVLDLNGTETKVEIIVCDANNNRGASTRSNKSELAHRTIKFADFNKEPQGMKWIDVHEGLNTVGKLYLEYEYTPTGAQQTGLIRPNQRVYGSQAGSYGQQQVSPRGGGYPNKVFSNGPYRSKIDYSRVPGRDRTFYDDFVNGSTNRNYGRGYNSGRGSGYGYGGW